MKMKINWFLILANILLLCGLFSCNLLLTSIDCSMGVAGGAQHCAEVLGGE